MNMAALAPTTRAFLGFSNPEAQTTDLKSLYNAKLSNSKIAEKTGLSVSQVRTKINNMIKNGSLQPRPKKNVDLKTKVAVVTMMLDGMEGPQAVEWVKKKTGLNVAQSTIYKWKEGKRVIDLVPELQTKH